MNDPTADTERKIHARFAFAKKARWDLQDVLHLGEEVQSDLDRVYLSSTMPEASYDRLSKLITRLEKEHVK